MLNDSLCPLEPSSTIPSSHLSYLIRPTAPCVLGTEHYVEQIEGDDDEFFLTAGGIIHSCPNIYELSMDHSNNNRRLQSCEHLLVSDRRTTSSNDDHHDHDELNEYDTHLDRYSVLPRFQPIASSASLDSFNSELELYKERHAIGLSRNHYDDASPNSSLLPTTWRSDNYLVLMPLIDNEQNSPFLHLIDQGKRSRSYDVPAGPMCSSVAV